MCGQDYHLKDLKQLEGLTQLADYYCALPAVSKNLTVALLHDDFHWKWATDTVALARIAIKFHHRALFQNCVIRLSSRQLNFESAWNEDVQADQPVLRKGIRRSCDHVAASWQSTLSTPETWTEQQ